MEVSEFLKENTGGGFFTGVPDSQLKALCDYLMDAKGICKAHIIAANEGNCTALAAGHYLATGEIPVVYLQNSGIGNIINPVVSLLNDKVYAIPCIFIVGFRGEPGTKDEPQHVFQGEITEKLLMDVGISTAIVRSDTSKAELCEKSKDFLKLLNMGKSVAFIIAKDGLFFDKKVKYKNNNIMQREEIIRHITKYSGDDVVVSTTGKASRELFFIREEQGQNGLENPHCRDFLTVGSMGHSSSIALGIALEKENTRVWCIDGDGAALMHMGAMAVIGSNSPQNMIHIIINNGAHETVGGMPTAVSKLDFVQLARGCGYPSACSVSDFDELDAALKAAKLKRELCFIEVKSAIGSRSDLGRPTTTAIENKIAFMEYLRGLD